MSETALHDLCKGFGALLSRSKTPGFAEEASRRNERGNLPLHAACSFQPTFEVIEVLLKSYPAGPTVTNSIGNLPLHQAAMWQASIEVVDLLLERHPEGAAVRNQYGSLPLHMAASNQAKPEVVRRLIDVYPDALHIQNDDGMTPLDLCLADEAGNEAVIVMLEGRPQPPDLTKRQQAEKFQDRADTLERKLTVFRENGGRQRGDLQLGILAIRRLADQFPHALFAAGIDPNELEMALSQATEEEMRGGFSAEDIILDMIKRNKAAQHGNTTSRNKDHDSGLGDNNAGAGAVRDRVEDLLDTIVGLDHIKSQVRGLRRTTEINDLLESMISPSPEERPRASHMIFIGNPGTGKTATARLLAKIYHELGILRKPKFLEVERMDLVARTTRNTIIKTREVMEEARGGILFIDEAYTLGLSSKRSQGADSGNDAILEIIRTMNSAKEGDCPLIIMAGFPEEMTHFLGNQHHLKSCFPLTFQFLDYTCLELAKVFADLAFSKGFDLGRDLTIDVIGELLEQETTSEWRSERNGRVSEMLLSGARTQVRRRMRAAQFQDTDEDVDPHLIVREDIENVITEDFK